VQACGKTALGLALAGRKKPCCSGAPLWQLQNNKAFHVGGVGQSSKPEVRPVRVEDACAVWR
jgi:hypothetical protein